ncbi:MAG: TdeIII family type II restriction endonuclease [Oscillatoria sp. SIO1A7]|nr:TdeIII family type II restriction endonuclease [Oscillatoria sp. SIO1A7]
MDEQLKADIKQSIESSIRKFFQGKQVKASHVLDLLLPNERRIRSLIGGLETSLGITVWQPVAQVIAKANGFTVEAKKLMMPKPLPQVLAQEFDTLIRENKEGWPPMEDCVARLREAARGSDRDNLNLVAPPASKAVDLYLSKEGKEYAFDLKSVQINKRSGLDFKIQLLEWYAYKLCEDPSAQFEARIVFPLNPYKVDWWKRQGDKAYPLERAKDAWVQDEFWDFCAGQGNTWAEILEVFEELGKEGFGENFRDIFYS